MRVMIPYWTNSGNRSWTVTVNSKTLIATFRLQLWQSSGNHLQAFMHLCIYAWRWLPEL